jgi:putative phosphoesterase
MDIAIVSDSHIPSRAQSIPDQFREQIRDADHALHAGDFDSESALADTLAFAPELTAVSGNMDGALGLPAVETVDLDGVRFVLTHGTGPVRGYEQRVSETVRDEGGDVGICGHTHEVLDTSRDGVRLLNPGSVTGAAPAERTTMMTAAVGDGSVDVTVHEL